MSDPGGVVKGVTDALRVRPDFLVLVVFNVIVLGILYMVTTSRSEQAAKERIDLIERCVPTWEKK